MTQEEALDILKLGCNVFLTGGPGAGKTFILNKYISYLKKQHKGVAITASTGIAATHMNGVTIHSWSGMGIKDSLNSKEIKKLLAKSYLKKRFREINVLIIDEISMLLASQFDLVNRICQAFKGDFRPFGGMQIICAGDLFQLPPVEKNGERAKFVVESQAWQNMDIKICYLLEQHRHEDQQLVNLLNYIRHNEVEASWEILQNVTETDKIFSILPTKLYTHNVDVDAINNCELAKIQGKEFVYQMESMGIKDMVDSLIKNCLAPQELVLKKGAQVMFVKNNFEEGYVNGTRGQVIDFNEGGLPIVKTFSGKQIVATPLSWTIEEDDEVKAAINQIPLRLAWAITIHKSQGMSLDTAEINLSKCFVEGMGYVALSRLKSLNGLKLLGINELALRTNEDVQKIDGEFRKMSEQVVQDLKSMPLGQKEKKQAEFLLTLLNLDSATGTKGNEDKKFQQKETGELNINKTMAKTAAKPKNFNCENCGRAINHKGNCLPCNLKFKYERERKSFI